jgi:hypothetical protein
VTVSIAGIVARKAEKSELQNGEGKAPAVCKIKAPLAPNLKERLIRLLKPQADSVRHIFNFLPDFLPPDGTLPDHANPPALFLIIPDCCRILFPIAGKFLSPKILIGMGKVKIMTLCASSLAVSVPETAVNENHRKIAGKNKVRPSRIPLVTNPVSKTRPP